MRRIPFGLYGTAFTGFYYHAASGRTLLADRCVPDGDTWDYLLSGDEVRNQLLRRLCPAAYQSRRSPTHADHLKEIPSSDLVSVIHFINGFLYL
jgi:hypothetical protein